MSGLQITTPRFVLRELTSADASARYLSWFSDPTAARYIASASRTSELQHLRDYIQERAGRDDVLFLGIFDGITGAHIGNVKYEPVDSEHGYAIMGLLIGDPAWRGRGVAKEVLLASGRWLRDLMQIVLGVSRDNLGAIRAYEAVGFAIEASPYVPYDSHPQYLSMVWHL
jgi:RimJ/RimL family protein N-acetyltransferase